jgi:uncharacterized protein involved in response to NO
VPAHALFFPFAAAYAAAALPASVLAMQGLLPGLPGLAWPTGHAHEMIFGFALAVVAGHQLGPTAPPMLALLAGTWLAARGAFLFSPGHAVTAAANGAFAVLLALQLAPRLFTRAKKLRNRALPAALVGLCASAVLVQATLQAPAPVLQRTTLAVAVLLLALLMLFMGGRIIAPAAAGALYRQGGDLAARVQPRLEAALIATMLAAIAAAALGANRIAGACALVAAAVAAVRLARWRIWALRGRHDLTGLAMGYGWLAAGLAAIGLALVRGAGLATALHIVTVGALGTLSIVVMALNWLRWTRRDPAGSALPRVAAALVAVATLARLAADFLPARAALLLLAAAAWSAGYAALLALMATTRRASV